MASQSQASEATAAMMGQLFCVYTMRMRWSQPWKGVLAKWQDRLWKISRNARLVNWRSSRLIASCFLAARQRSEANVREQKQHPKRKKKEQMCSSPGGDFWRCDVFRKHTKEGYAKRKIKTQSAKSPPIGRRLMRNSCAQHVKIYKQRPNKYCNTDRNRQSSVSQLFLFLFSLFLPLSRTLCHAFSPRSLAGKNRHKCCEAAAEERGLSTLCRRSRKVRTSGTTRL